MANILVIGAVLVIFLVLLVQCSETLKRAGSSILEALHAFATEYNDAYKVGEENNDEYEGGADTKKDS